MEMVESGSSSQEGGYMTPEEFKEWIKQGNGYAMGLLPSTEWIGPMRLEDVELPEGAPAEYHYDFNDIWRRYCLQINYTNGMDVDTYPGRSMEAETGPLDLSIPKEELEGFWHKQYELRIELAEFAINQYNEESNVFDTFMMELAEFAINLYNEESDFFKYELVKIEKANFRLSGYSEFFMTVKVRNVTLGTLSGKTFIDQHPTKPSLSVSTPIMSDPSFEVNGTLPSQPRELFDDHHMQVQKSTSRHHL
ncbi:hypothetical protein T459_31440 [Capsicum annuum]|uniref:Uncharacterized protein n=1 Tax=Capsicum annuum TaxID=4072 RepID=A0A2G2YB85_CAPAN|nr:hypothetical protein T459_31440 [Capsicum annuum]